MKKNKQNKLLILKHLPLKTKLVKGLKIWICSYFKSVSEFNQSIVLQIYKGLVVILSNKNTSADGADIAHCRDGCCLFKSFIHCLLFSVTLCTCLQCRRHLDKWQNPLWISSQYWLCFSSSRIISSYSSIFFIISQEMDLTYIMTHVVHIWLISQVFLFDIVQMLRRILTGLSCSL